jgi:uncharacterized protein (DUF58 family)
MKTASENAPESPSLRRRLLELELGELRLRARQLAAGFQMGLHLSNKRGPGMEFLGHRAYSPGDDLRHLDRRALLRHRRYLLREFHVETERPLHLIVDISASMNFADESRGAPDSRASASAPVLPRGLSKAGFARVTAAALALLAGRAGDPVGLSVLHGFQEPKRLPDFLPPRGGSEQLERILAQLESDIGLPVDSPRVRPQEVVLETANRLPARSTVLWLSDFLDDDIEYAASFPMFSAKARTLVGVQILTQAERTFPYQGPIVLTDPESGVRVETDGNRGRAEYLAALGAHNHRVEEAMLAAGGSFLSVDPSFEPRLLLRKIAEATGARDR